ncbi:hypothetical protein H072_7514 [Dactylellina haptotyla CBS 200.50]|uniref:H-type lectin domain-containing protein n=1 Tax=Dactylellina haptotyla (strain CBS 200.50) TaxID=1284197 RepID=S8BHC8_DACHA|nr:hypothetical protein H072_7514 [Dactylellina haptotyla CBS 200.50]
MRPPDTGRSIGIGWDTPTSQKSFPRSRTGSDPRTTTAQMMGIDSGMLSPPWRDHDRSRSNASRDASTSSAESRRRRKGKGITSDSPPRPATASRRGSSPASPSEMSEQAFGMAKLRIRHGEPVSKRDWGSASDVSVPGQDVRFMARFVDNFSDITEDMNISGARSIKRGRIDGIGGDSFIDVEKFKQADLNFYVRVRVINQKVDAREVLQFNPEWIIVDGEFTQCFGDSFISGFTEGGEFNALLSIKVFNKSKVKAIEAGVRAAFGKSLFTLDSMGKEEWERRDIDDNTEITVSAIWSGGGRIKSSEKQWPIHSLMEAAASFPDLVASEPHRTHAIITSYPYLRNFYQDGELQIPLAPYAYAIQRTKALLDAYLDYKSVRQRLNEDVADIQNGDKVFQSKEYFRRANAPLRRELSSIDDDSKFAATLVDLDQAINAAAAQMKRIMEEVDLMVRDPESAMEMSNMAKFQNPDVFRSRLPKLLPRTAKNIVARSAVVVQSDESEDLYLVSSGGNKANMSRGKFIPQTAVAENFHFAGSHSFVKNSNQSSGHIVKRIRNETHDQLPPRIFTGIRQFTALAEALTDPSMKFRMYSTNETAKGITFTEVVANRKGQWQLYSGTFDVLAVSRADPNFLSGSVEGRGVREWAIKFSRAFRKPPEIVIWLTGLDIYKTPDASIDLEVRAVTTTGFRFLPKIANPETWVSFSWLAYDADTGGIVSGFLEFGSREHEYSEVGKVEFPPGTFAQRPRVLAAVHGLSWFPMTEEEQPHHSAGKGKGKERNEGEDVGIAEIEMEITKTTVDGFGWGFRAAVPKGCKLVMQWIAVA